MQRCWEKLLKGKKTNEANYTDYKTGGVGDMYIFDSGNEVPDMDRATALFRNVCGTCCFIDRTDGIRMSFSNDEIIHLRPSGNAPEFRCYNEAATVDRVTKLNANCMKILTTLKTQI